VKTFAENKVGLERNGFDAERIAALHKAFRILSRAGLNTTQAIERIREEIGAQADVAELIEFIGASERGFIK
jgi:UDP-N-acetylglucosamine acyltransferase